jgi:Tol biopolymer transport system component
MLAVSGAILLVMASMAVWVGWIPPGWLERVPLVERVATRWVPPAVAVGANASGILTREEEAAVGRLRARLAGRVVWSSNRAGNHELYDVDLATGAVRQLTRSPHVEFFSRYSPDGGQLLFLRSQRPWVSFREMDAWDLYVMPAQGGEARRVAVSAYTPAWSSDGRRITFTRRNTIVEVDVGSGRERIVHDGRHAPTQSSIPEAEPGPDGLMALSRRHVRPESVGIADLGADRYTPVSEGRACQISWVPGRRAVLWVDPTGHGGTRIMEREVDGASARVLMDLPGEISHEYFPRLSRDGRWLVWGASAGGHEHDRADYEIFVWERGTPYEQAIRLTHSPANDQWPDLFIPRSAS